MLRYYLKTTWRNIRKDRLFTILNLVGLSTGLVCTILIYLWVTDELKVDKYNAKDRDLYQVMVNEREESGIKTASYTPGPLASALKAEIPEVEYATPVIMPSWFPNKGVISNGKAQLKAGPQFVGKDYFDVFSCHFIDGDKQNLFADKRGFAISSKLAEKLFNTTRGLIGKPVRWDHGEFSGTYFICGVFTPNPANATNQFDVLMNFELFVAKRPGMLEWGNSDPQTFLILKPKSVISAVNNKLGDFLQKWIAGSKNHFFVTRYSDKYLYGQFENGVQSGGRISYVKMFSIVAVFILLIACVNFMNLSTATASRRMKEVGIKKVVGAGRKTLIFHYLSESVMLSFLSTLISLVVLIIILPGFNQIAGKELQLNVTAPLIFAVIGIALITGLLAGSYPAFYLSGFNPVSILKGKLQAVGGEVWIRKGLVVFQFSLSVMFIVAVLVVYRQIDFIQTKNLGYNRQHVIHFEIPFGMEENQLKRSEAFLNEIKRIPGVVSGSSYYHNLTGDHGGIGGLDWPGKPAGVDVNFANLEVGYHFLETVDMKIKEGKSFSYTPSSEKEILFNETAIRTMGLKDPVGKTIKFWGTERQIVGVVQDFNFESLYSPVKPCFFQTYPILPNIIVRIQAGTEHETIRRIERLFQQANPGLLFDYRFLDEDYQALYAAERRVGVLSKYFAGLAIVISCLGLFGLTAFTAQKRQKEIGIRKVIGATTTQVTFLLSKDFVKLVLIAVLIAFPVAWWALTNWLNSFAYRVPIHSDIFLITAASTMVITLVTISFQAIKAAVQNPVRSLRTE